MLKFLLISALAFSSISLVAAPIRICCMGDSITQGIGTAGSNGGYSWRYWLWKSMIEAGYSVNFVGSRQVNEARNVTPPAVNGFAFDKDHEGHSGWRADHLIEGRNVGQGKLSEWLTLYTPDILILMIGTNDSLALQSADSTVDEIEDIIRAVQLDSPGVTVLACSPPKTQQPAPEARVVQINAALRDNASSWSTAGSAVYYVDCTSGYNSASLNYDGIHPNASGERELAGRIFEQFTTVVGPESFDAWMEQFTTVPVDQRGPEADPNQDGMTNYQHYVFGGNPIGSSPRIVPMEIISQTAEGTMFSIHRRRHSSLTGTILESSDLINWAPTEATISIPRRTRDGFYDDLEVFLEADRQTKLFYKIDYSTP